MKSSLKSVSLLIGVLLTSICNINCQSNCIIKEGTQDNTKINGQKKPQDSFYASTLNKAKTPLPYNYIHEKDVFWEKKDEI